MILVYMTVIGMYNCSIAIRTNTRLHTFTKNRKQNPLLGDDASTAEAAPSRIEGDEQGGARRANTTTPKGGSHLELCMIGCLQLKNWSKSDILIAETTWPTQSVHVFVFV